MTTEGLTDAKFYLTDDVSYPEDFTLKLPIYSGKTVTLCLNGHKITVGKDPTEANKKPLFTVRDGATLNICDCQGDGVMQGGLNRDKDPRFGGKTLESLIQVEGGGTLNLYSGKLYGEYGMFDKVVDGTTYYMKPIVQLEDGSTFNMSGGTVEHWMHPDSASSGLRAYCPSVSGDGTFTVTGGTLIGAIANYVKIDGADEKNPVYIDGNCYDISGKTIRNAVIKKASYLRELYNMENVTIEEADDTISWNWDGEYTLTNCNLSGVRLDCTDKHTLTMTNSTVGSVEDFKQVNATNSTIQGAVNNSSVRVGVSVNEASLTGCTVGGPIAADSITLTDTNVTDTVTASATGTITVGGSTTVTDLYLKNGQKFNVDNLSDNAKINVRSDGAGELIANPPGFSLEGKVTTGSGELSFGTDGQVTIVPSLDHAGKNYTALVQDSAWTGTHRYYLTQNWTGDITIPKDANITLCLHQFDVTGNITVEEGGTLYLEAESEWYSDKRTIHGQIVNNGTLELRKVGWTEANGGINYYDYNCIDVNSGSETAIVNTSTLTWRYHDKSYITTGESPGTVTNDGTAPTIVNSGTMDVQKIAVINNGAGPVLSNTAGTARLAGSLTTAGNSEAVKVTGGEVKITRVTSGASGENSAAIVAAGGSVECVHENNSNTNAVLSAPNAETVIRVEAGSTFKFDAYNNIYDPDFGTGTKYTLVNNGGTVSMGGNHFVLKGVLLNKAGTMNLTKVQATGNGQVVVDGGTLTVSGATAEEDLQKDIIMLNGGAVVLAGGAYKTNAGYYAVRVANKDTSLTAKGDVNMPNSAVYLCTDAKMAVLKDGDAPRVKIVMQTPGVFAENVTDSSLTSTVSSADANYAVKHNAADKTLYLELTGEHKHDSTTYEQLKDTDTALTAGYYYLPQSVKMNDDLTISGDVTICLNGNTLSFSERPFGYSGYSYYHVKVQDGGTLTIQDELTGGGKLTDGGIQLAPTANFTLESGTLEAQEAVRITGSTEGTNTNKVTIKGGAITAPRAIRNVVSGATVNVTGGTLTMPKGSGESDQALVGMNGGALNISGGTWVQENQSGGMLVGRNDNQCSTGTVTVTGGDFTIGRSGFELYDGTASFSNVAFTTLPGKVYLSNAISCYGNAQVELNKVTFDTIHGVSVSDTASATLTDVTVKTYDRNTQLVNVGKTASATVESASIQPGMSAYNTAAINNAGTLTVKKLTVADGISLNVSNSGGTATYNDLDLSGGTTYFTVSGGTMNLNGGSFTADTNMFTVKGGTANVNGSTLALKNNSEKSRYTRYFFQLTGGEANLNGATLVADTGTKYPYVANGTGGTLKLDGELKYTKVEEGAVLRTMLTAPDNYKIVLGDSFSSAAPITFRFEGTSLDFADTAWTDKQKANFAMPKGYTWAIGESTTGIKKEANAAHSHTDGTQFYKALSKDITAEEKIKTYTIPADNLYLTKDITWTIPTGYNSYHRFEMNGERYLCLNGHSLTLKLGTSEDWRTLYSEDIANQKLTITNCTEHPSTIYGSIDLSSNCGVSWDKYKPTDRLVLENLTVAGRIDMRKVKYTGEDYTTSLNNVTVVPPEADTLYSTVQLGAGKHIIKNSTLTYNEPDSYKDYDYGALYLYDANAEVTLEGTVNITGGFGLYGRGGTVDASKLNPDSKIVLGAGKSSIYDEYKYTITGVTKELRSCFTLSNYAPTSYYKPENYRLVYDAEAQTLKLENVEMYNDKDSKVKLTVTCGKSEVASGESATLYASWSTDDTACTLESYQWYAVDENGKKTIIPDATGETYTTDKLTPGTHRFTAVAYYTIKGLSRTWRKDATYVIVKVNASVDINTNGITITGLTDGSKTYDGTAVSYNGTATAEGYNGEFEYKWFKVGEDGTGTLLTAAPKDVGSYYLKVSVPSGTDGYSGEAKVNFTISPATITVTPTADQSKVYGTADTALTYKAVGAAESETAEFTGALGRETGENAGTYAITQGNLALADKGTFKTSNYTLVFSEDMVNFTISRKPLTSEGITAADIVGETYTGNAIKPAVTVKDGEKTLTADDYTVTYESNTNAGTATAKITGKGNYTDEVSKAFTINPRALENDMITAIDAQVYTGSAITPEPEVKYGEIKLEKGKDYTVSYESNTAVGTATVTVAAVASGNYAGSAAANFTIGTKPITADMITISGTYTYTGSAITPAVAVKYGGVTLTEDTDYTVGLSNNTNAGEATVKITGTGNYSGEASKDFTISRKPLTSEGITAADIAGETYTGNAIKPAVTVKDGEKTLTADDYTVTYESNTNAGTATAKITGKGNYTDEVSKAFTINPRALENDMITAIDAQVYTGKAITPEPEVKYGEFKLEKDADYTVSYESNTAVGTATVTVTAVASGNYAGSAAANFTIGRADQTLGKTDMTATYGETFEVTPITGAQGEVTYAVKSGSESLLTKGEDGKFTAKSGTGTAYITATAAQTANYKQTSIDIPVELSKAHLTAKADDKSMYVNGTVPTDLIVSYTGFVNGDTKDKVVDNDATASIAAEVDGKTTGTFAITTNTDTKLKSGMEDNYTVAVQNGTLTISRRSSGGSGGGVRRTTYPVTVPDKTDNGSASVNPKSSKQGDTVTITVTPDKGYIPETITVTDKDGKELTVTKESDTQYTFVMPASKVEVKATFMDDNTMLNYFVDVKTADYYYDAVLWAAQMGITGGTDDVHFSPNDPCTRSQIVTFLWRAAGSPEPKSMGSFTDVSGNSYYAKAVAWAVENGITGGTGDGKFSPNDTCTREQAVAFLYRAAGSPAVSGGSAFGDVAANAYYANAVAWAVENDITGGIGGGLFGSGNDCTRAQIVTFLYRSSQAK